MWYYLFQWQQETSLRPDIKHGRVPSRSSSMSPLPPPVAPSDFYLPRPPQSSANLDYSSAFLCRLPLRLLQPRPPEREADLEAMEIDFVSIMDKLGPGIGEVSDQSHLTQVLIGCDEDPQECPSTEAILEEVTW